MNKSVPEVCRRICELLERRAAGAITAAESAEYWKLIDEFSALDDIKHALEVARRAFSDGKAHPIAAQMLEEILAERAERRKSLRGLQ